MSASPYEVAVHNAETRLSRASYSDPLAGQVAIGYAILAFAEAIRPQPAVISVNVDSAVVAQVQDAVDRAVA